MLVFKYSKYLPSCRKSETLIELTDRQKDRRTDGQTDSSDFIGPSVGRGTKNKVPMLAHNNALGHCPNIKELEDLCPRKVMLISQIVPFMFIVGKTKGVIN